MISSFAKFTAKHVIYTYYPATYCLKAFCIRLFNVLYRVTNDFEGRGSGGHCIFLYFECGAQKQYFISLVGASCKCICTTHFVFMYNISSF